MKRLAIFVSGSGSNCENIIRYFHHGTGRNEGNPAAEDIRIALVVSNKADAYALKRAENLGVPSVVMPKSEFNQQEKVIALLEQYHIDFIVLAGFLLMVPDFLIDAYPRRIINIHPSLLPKYGGRGMWGHHVHEAVKKAGEEETGMTVHYVSNVCDGGEIIAQFKTALSPSDTPDDIAEKEHVLEMAHFPKVIEQVVSAL